ncbi:MAG: ribosome silencing factor [Desulfovibrionales bacterium]
MENPLYNFDFAAGGSGRQTRGDALAKQQKKKQKSDISSEQKTNLIVDWLSEKQGRETIAILVRGLCSITDAMVVVTAQNRRHAKTLADWVLKKAGENNLEYFGMEGYANAAWILLDLNDVLVHIFQPEERTLYDIEGLWSEGEIMYRQEQVGAEE